MKLGKRGKLAIYLSAWALIGVVLLSLPTLVSPIAERALTTSDSTTLTSPKIVGGNTTSTHIFSVELNGTSNSLASSRGISTNQTFNIQSPYPTNITITATAGNPSIVTITSTAPANITVISKQPEARNAALAASAPLSNIPEFALRLSLVLVPAVLLSSLGMVRVRRRLRREFATDAD